MDHMLTPVCLRLTNIPMSKVIMDGEWNGIIYLVGHLCGASSRPLWKCLCVKEGKLHMERLWKVKTQQVWVPQEWRL